MAYAYSTKISAWICNHTTYVAICLKLRIHAGEQWVKEKDKSRMSILFRNAHAVAKQNRPYMDYVWVCRLDRAKGLDIGDTYLNDKACAAFVDNISIFQ